MSLRNLRIRTRFTILLALFVAGFTLYGAWSLRTLGELKIKGPLYEHIVQTKDLVADILPPPVYILESYLTCLQLAATGDVAQQEQRVQRLAALRKEYEARHAHWRQAGLEAEIGEPLLKAAHEPALAFYRIAFEELVPALRRDDRPAVAAAMERVGAAYESHRRAIDRVVELANRRADADEQRAQETDRAATWLLVVIFVAAMGISVGVAWLIVRSIVVPLYESVEIARTFARGDLGAQIRAEGRSETAQLLGALGDMQHGLVGVVSRVRQGAQGIATSSAEIAQSNQDLSARTESQASALQETAASMEKLSTAIQHNADHARQANALAQSAGAVALKGGEVVAQVVDTMKGINDSSHRIAQIIGVIDGIAFQTNILALNAAVEAARAGEQGRGFAVVAGEVRSLAGRSAEAAKEIKQLITDSVERVGQGNALVDQAGATMNDMVASIRRVTDIMGEISSASAEQSRGVLQVSQAVTSMDQVTQQNAALVEEMAAAASSLKSQADDLVQTVAVFRLAQDAHEARDVLPLNAGVQQIAFASRTRVPVLLAGPYSR